VTPLPASLLPSLSLDSGREIPMYRQLYDWFRQSIADGQLRPGQRLPSTRNLAAELKISRIPVFNAYEQLCAEGYLETFVGAGTCVAKSIPDESLAPALKKGSKGSGKSIGRARPRRISDRGMALSRVPAPCWLNSLGAFRVSLPAVDHFPIRVWSKLVNRHSRMLQPEMMAYGDSMGHLQFREAIAQYLATARGVRCDSSQILVTTGSQQALQLCAQVLLDPKDCVGIEEPGYPGARQAFLSAGSRLIPVHVDDDGIKATELVSRGDALRAVYITPSHQYPLGMTMSATRRMEVLNWAERSGTWIIEDDYDSEYRFGSRPIVSLQGLDKHSRVIYIGTFSKVLFPSLRLGYMVLPEDLVQAFSASRDAADIFSSTLYQAVLADFIQEGHFARHLRRMRMLYMERRSMLVKAISDQMGKTLEVVGAEAGMHVVALLTRGIDDLVIARRAAERGLSVMPLSSCYLKLPVKNGLILGYGGTNAEQINEAMRELKRVIHR
jgi:GntR family transcriptional regulator / MocR family aminotransferase